MPYSLRKVPGKHLWWVVDPSGKHLSHEGLPRERAEAQRRAVYASEHQREMEGGTNVFSSTSPDYVAGLQQYNTAKPYDSIRNLELDQLTLRDISHKLEDGAKTSSGAVGFYKELGALGARVLADDVYDYEGVLAAKNNIPMRASYGNEKAEHLKAQDFTANQILFQKPLDRAINNNILNPAEVTAITSRGHKTIDQDELKRRNEAARGLAPAPAPPAPAPAPAPAMRPSFSDTDAFAMRNAATGPPLPSVFASPQPKGFQSSATLSAGEPFGTIDEAVDPETGSFSPTDMAAATKASLDDYSAWFDASTGKRISGPPSPEVPAARSRSATPDSLPPLDSPSRPASPPPPSPPRAPSPPPRAPSPPKKTPKEIADEKEAADQRLLMGTNRKAIEESREEINRLKGTEEINQVIADKYLNDYNRVKAWFDEKRAENDRLAEEKIPISTFFIKKYSDELRPKVITEYIRRNPTDSPRVAQKAVEDILAGKRGLEQQQSLLYYVESKAVILGRESSDPEVKAKVAEADQWDKDHTRLEKALENQEAVNRQADEAKARYKQVLQIILTTKARITELEKRIKEHEKEINEKYFGVKEGKGRRHKHRRRHGGCASCGGNDRFD